MDVFSQQDQRLENITKYKSFSYMLLMKCQKEVASQQVKIIFLKLSLEFTKVPNYIIWIPIHFCISLYLLSQDSPETFIIKNGRNISNLPKGLDLKTGAIPIKKCAMFSINQTVIIFLNSLCHCDTILQQIFSAKNLNKVMSQGRQWRGSSIREKGDSRRKRKETYCCCYHHCLQLPLSSAEIAESLDWWPAKCDS